MDSNTTRSSIIRHKELKEIFNCGTNPVLIRTMEAQGIPYMIDAKGNPFVHEQQLMYAAAKTATPSNNAIEFADLD